MRRYLPLLMCVLALSGLACPPPPPPPVDPVKKDDAKVVTPPRPIESQDGLKSRIEAALTQIHNTDLRADTGFWTIFHGILGMGLEKTMLTLPEGKKVRAIDYICEGGKLEGLRFVPTPHGLDVEDVRTRPDLEFYAQGHQDQFVAEMAQWGMDREHKFKVEGKDYKFLDFANHSKMRASTTQSQELSWAIIMVAQFYDTDHAWTNASNEKLHFEDIVRYEVNANIPDAACGGTHRLFGITWAYHLHMKKGGKKTGVWLDAANRIDEYKRKARELQNPDRTFSTDYFKGKGNINDLALRIGTTGHIVEWLALAMTDEELREPWMQEAVSALSLLILDSTGKRVNGGALYHATHGLQLYHDRVFGKPAAYLPLRPRS